MGEKLQLQFKLVTGQIESIEINQVYDLEIDVTVLIMKPCVILYRVQLYWMPKDYCM